MKTSGQQIIVDLSQAGWNYIPNEDALPNSFLSEVLNITYIEGGCKKRKGTIINKNVGSVFINGGFQYSVGVGTERLITYDNNGVIKKDSDSLITLTGNCYPCFAKLGDNLYIVNGFDIVQKFNGNSITNLESSNIPTDWSGSNQPKWIIQHGSGNSRRLWAGLKNTIYISNLETDNFSDDCVTLLYIDTGDGYGLIGATELYGQLVIFGKNKAYFIDDTNPDSTLWSYRQAPWFAGAAHQRLIITTSNNIICMTDNGDIYSVVGVQTSNDYQLASLTKASGLDIWIKQNCNLNQIDKFHGIFDPYNRVVLFFVVTGSNSSVDTCLVYHIDRPLEIAWSKYNNTSFNCGYKAASSWQVKNLQGKFTIQTGDLIGNIWNLNETDADNNQTFKSSLITNWINCGEYLTKKRFNSLAITSKAYSTSLTAKCYIDGNLKTSSNLTFFGVGIPLGTFILGTDYLVIPEPADSIIQIQENGKRIKISVETSTLNNQFYLTALNLNVQGLESQVQ